MGGKRKIQITHEELLSVLRGHSYVELPEDAVIWDVKSGNLVEIFEFHVISNSYPKLNIGEMVPSEQAKIVSVQTSAAGGEEVQK